MGKQLEQDKEVTPVSSGNPLASLFLALFDRTLFNMAFQGYGSFFFLP